MDKLNVEAWVGRQTLSEGSVSVQQVTQIQATLGIETALGDGDALPPLWHWYAFPTSADMSALGPDGHVRRSDLLPPVHLNRRMWAGGSLTFHSSLRVGETIERRSSVRSVKEKMGATGPMVFVSLDHELYTPRGLAVQERQDIVYLDIPNTYTPPEKRAMPVAPHETIDTPETLLFRYSAVTFNAHRIHYDLPYTRDVEKYPNLVVHGPLQASLLMQAATRHKGRRPLFFDFRGVHPMFAGTPCDIAMQEDDEGLQLWTAQDGHQCMQARAVWEETQ